MCGIICAFNLKQPMELLRPKVLQMSKKIRHRGPDWSGIYSNSNAIIAHERLAIVDPTSGKQPLFSDDNRYILAANGEIYNHREIRKKLKNKYQQLRDQKIRERVEALGVKIQEGDDRETLLRKEREYNLARQKIELALESFYRSANSLVFQLNKRYITKHMSILRCIDRRFETGEIFIKWDETIDDDWLILIYIKDNSPDKGIIIEDKSNEEKNMSHEFKPSDIFKASDMMVDSLTQLIARKRSKKN